MNADSHSEGGGNAPRPAEAAPVLNGLGQPVGALVEHGLPCPLPPRTRLEGRHCDIVPLDVEAHAAGLHAANADASDHSNWTYLPYGPFADLAAYTQWLRDFCSGEDPCFHTVLDKSGGAVGLLAMMRINAEHGVIEVGHIHFAPSIQRSPATTEALYLVMRRVFDELGYRRLEWKCDALNARSRSAARRLGFVYEGTFRKHVVANGRNQDTAWFSLIDDEWPAVRSAFERWLDPANFDGGGVQRVALGSLMPEGQRGVI